MSGPLTLRLLPGRPLTPLALGKRLLRVHKDRRAGGLAPRFSLSSREQRFVRTLLAVKDNFWLWRCRQDAFAGDFVLVDMSATTPDARMVTVLELKQGATVRPTAGHQMQNVPAVLDEIAQRSGVIPRDAAWQPLTGDGGQLVAHLSAGRRTQL